MLQCVNITEVNLLTNKLFDYVLNSKAATSLLEKKGNFVFGDTTGISLLFSAIFSKKPCKYSIICPNLYNAQKVADFISSLSSSNNEIVDSASTLSATSEEISASSTEAAKASARNVELIAKFKKSMDEIIERITELQKYTQ